MASRKNNGVAGPDAISLGVKLLISSVTMMIAFGISLGIYTWRSRSVQSLYLLSTLPPQIEVKTFGFRLSKQFVVPRYSLYMNKVDAKRVSGRCLM